MIRAARFSVATMAVLNHIGCPNLAVSMRLRGAGYHKYSVKPAELAMNNFNRHWFRHFFVAYSPGGILPLPFEIWLGFPEGFRTTPYQIGMVRSILVRACAPEWSYVERIAKDLESRITEDCTYLTENWMFGHWVRSCVSYVKWYWVVQADYSLPLSTLLDPLPNSSLRRQGL